VLEAARRAAAKRVDEADDPMDRSPARSSRHTSAGVVLHRFRHDVAARHLEAFPAEAPGDLLRLSQLDASDGWRPGAV
jgi:hypothetical protein